MRHFLILCVLFASFNVFADSWFETTTNWFGEIWDLFTIHTPNMFERFITWVYIWVLKVKIYLQYESVKFYYTIASTFLSELQLTQLLSTYISRLEPDLQYVINVTKLPDAFMLIIEAYVTRFIMRL